MISCSSVQRPLARRLHQRLVLAGCNPKLDHLDIREGERWRQTIAWWLSACQVAVVLLSEEAVDSPWVRYELSVLSNREHLGNLKLVAVYVGLARDEVIHLPELEPLHLDQIQSYHELVDGKPDDDDLDALVRVIDSLGDVDDPPVEQLVTRVADHIRDVADDRVFSARAGLDGPGRDPWLVSGNDMRRDFGDAYCATPIDRTYPSLQTLAQDEHLDVDDLNTLIDLNVMTAFDSRTIDQFHQAGLGHGTAGGRRSLVTSITRADLADVAAESVRFHAGVLYPFRFVVQGPATGRTSSEVAQSLADELRHTIAEKADHDETPEEFLDAVARRRHPVFVLLAGMAGISPAVLSSLEQCFPTVVFVVLSSPRCTMLALAQELDLVGVGAELDDDATWAQHVEYERELGTERSTLRHDLHRLKRALRP